MNIKTELGFQVMYRRVSLGRKIHSFPLIGPFGGDTNYHCIEELPHVCWTEVVGIWACLLTSAGCRVKEGFR